MATRSSPSTVRAYRAAIAAFERTLETNQSAFDLYQNGKDTTLFSVSAKRGQIIFNEKASQKQNHSESNLLVFTGALNHFFFEFFPCLERGLIALRNVINFLY